MIRPITSEEIKLLSNQISYKISFNSFEKCFAYEEDNEIIGLIDFSDIYNRLELNYIWIKSNYRGNKKSNALMEYLMDYAKINKVENITLEVSTNNYIAINLYKKYGFVEVALRKQYYNGTDGILMMRKFDKNE